MSLDRTVRPKKFCYFLSIELLHLNSTPIPIMSPTSSYSSSASDPTEETWDDWTEDAVPCPSLFDGETFATAQLALEHDKSVHGVDLVLLGATLGMLSSRCTREKIRADGN